MVSMKNQRLSLDPGGRSGSPRVVPTPTRNPVTKLSEALQILGARLREAAAERRASPPGSDRYRRADERVAYLNELYGRLQRRMEVPAEIWLLDGGPTRNTRRRSDPRP